MRQYFVRGFFAVLLCTSVLGAPREKEEDASAEESKSASDEGDSRDARFFNIGQRNRRHHPLDVFFHRIGQSDGSATFGSGGRPTAVFVDINGGDSRVTPHRGSFNSGQQSPVDGFFSLIPDFGQAWWKGPNICTTKKEEEVDGATGESLLFKIESKQCQESPTTYTCTTKIRTSNESKNVIEKHTCCHGFTRRKDGRPGCIEAELKDLSSTLQGIGATEFMKVIDDSQVIKRGGPDENITVFSPTNIALKDQEVGSANEVPTQADTANAHMVQGFYSLADLTDEMKIATLDGKSSIRFNEFYNPNKVLTANCVPIVSADNFHKTGVVHVVDGTLPIPSKTVKEILANEPKYSIFNELISNSEMIDKLDDPEAHFTVFAPTDESFKKVETETLEMWKRGEGCVERLVMGHVIPHTICTTAVPEQARVRNVLRKPVMLQRDPTGKVTAEGVEVDDKDQIATNGVVHSLNGVMLSQTSKSLLETLKSMKMGDLVHLLESNELVDKLNNLKNFTFFAPTEEALKDVSLKDWETMKTDGKIQPMFLYHTTDSKLSLKSLFNNMIVPTELEESKIRINVYSRPNALDQSTFTAQCARIVSQSLDVCGGSVFLVNKVLREPEQSIMDIIEKHENLNVFRKLIQKAGLDNQLRGNAGPFTVLAPTDEAFNSLTKDEMEALEKGEGVEQLVKTHILPDMICTSGINHNNMFTVQEYRNLDGKAVSTQRSLREHVYFGGARASTKDLTSNNGVVHILDRVLSSQPEQKPSASRNRYSFDFPRLF